ncbi:MAG: hypothetical protein ACYCZF_11940 [Anaerolineae bacterium]
MRTNVRSKLITLNSDYEHIFGKPFAYFCCPILFKDEIVPLCKAHIVNLAFPNSSRHWTVQRKDVDNFYGSIFEAEFVDILYKEGRTLSDAIIDKTLSKKLKPTILVDNTPVDFFVAKNEIPTNFTRMDLSIDGSSVQLGLKMPPEDVRAGLEHNWEILVSKDVRIPALVSLIKAAHLTLFEMLGYSYAFSNSGYIVGREILGEFYLQNSDKTKSSALDSALPFFREFTHMVRPFQSAPANFQGTITDKLCYVCKEKDDPPWAIIVFVKTSKSLHAVMIPIPNQLGSIAKFLRFLHDDNDLVEIALARLENDRWIISNRSSLLPWPKDGVLYPT